MNTERARTTTSEGGLFRAFRNRNFRLFGIGNAISIIGTGAQTVGQGWLVVHVLGQSGSRLGLVLALNYLPLLLGAPIGGLFADRYARRTILLCTQAGLAMCAAALAIITELDVVTYGLVCVVSAASGIVMMFDTPARHSFTAELVGPDLVANAVSVNSFMFHTARVLGPLVATLLIPAFGVGATFVFNTLSFVAVLLGLAMMRSAELFRSSKPHRAGGEIREAVRYVALTSSLRTPLILLAVIGTFTMNYTVILPLLARDVFPDSSGALGMMTAAVSLGSVMGAAIGAWRARPTPGLLLGAASALGAALLLASLTTSLPVVLPILVIVGIGHIMYLNSTNALLQSQADPAMRGRVMSFYSQLFLGSTPVGAPVIGLVGDHGGARLSVVAAGSVALVAGAVASLGRFRSRSH